MAPMDGSRSAWSSAVTAPMDRPQSPMADTWAGVLEREGSEREAVHCTSLHVVLKQ